MKKEVCEGKSLTIYESNFRSQSYLFCHEVTSFDVLEAANKMIVTFLLN